MMKRITLAFCSMLLFFLLPACSVGEVQSPVNAPTSLSPSKITHESEKSAENSLVKPKDKPNSESSSESSIGNIVPENPTQTPTPSVPEEKAINSMQITVGSTKFSATLEENEAGAAFVKLLQNAPVVIQMSDNSGFEKVGSLGTSLPESNRQITAQAGDIILYSGNQICVFYGSNSWSYTKLGKVDDLSSWAEALGSGDVTLTFSIT